MLSWRDWVGLTELSLHLSARDGKASECTVLRDVHFAERLTERCVVYSFDWMNGDMKQIVCFFDSIWRQFQCGTAENG